MAAARRVLFLGITGVDKSGAVQRLADWYRNVHGQTARVINFEDEYLWKDPEARGSVETQRWTFLDAEIESQSSTWVKAWERFTNSEKSSLANNEPIFLSLHGCFLREHYGARCVFDPRKIGEDFRPDVIFTLITDVYDMWWRTESRAEGLGTRGRPSLEQLITARRQELAVGDLIALTSGSSVKNLMLSIHHPFGTFAAFITHPTERRVAYLSFAISQPRELEKKKDIVARQDVSKFISHCYEKQSRHSYLAIECPLAIDELPLSRVKKLTTLARYVEEIKSKKASEDGFPIEFDRDKLRWDMSEFWHRDTRMGLQAERRGPIPSKQLLEAWGNIETDVSWRDYRLVDQADYLIVFNPIFRNRDTMAQSVRQEINYAISRGKLVFVYQNQEEDKKNRVWSELGVPFGNDRATMKMSPEQQRINRVFTLDDLFDKLVKGR